MSAAVATTSPSSAEELSVTQTTPTKSGNNKQVLFPNEVDTTMMEFATRMGRDGQKKVYLNYGTSRLMVQTPWMLSYRGIEDTNASFGDTGSPPKYQIRCSLQDYETAGSESADFVTMLQKTEA